MDEKLKLIARVSNVAVTLSLDGSEALESLPPDQFKRLCTDAGVSDSEEAHEVVKLVCGTDLFGSTATIESLRLSVGRDHVRDLAKMLYSGWLLDATREGVSKNYDFVMMSRLFEEGRASEFAQPFSAWIGNDLTSDLRDALAPVIGKVEGSPAAEPERHEPVDQPDEDSTESEAHDTEADTESKDDTKADSEDNAETSDTESKADTESKTDTEADAEDTAETSDTKSDTESKTDAVTEAHDTVTETHDTVTEAHSVEAEASNADAEASDDGTVTETPDNVTERHETADQPSDDSAQGSTDAESDEQPAVPGPADDFDELDDASDDDAEGPSQAVRDALLTTTKLPPYDDMDEGSVDPVGIDGSDDDLVDSLGLGKDDDGDDGDNPTTVLNRAAHMASSEKRFYRSVNRMKNIFSDGPRPGLSDEE